MFRRRTNQIQFRTPDSWKRGLALAIATAFLMSVPGPLAAEDICTGVIITEIMYNPSEDQGSDFTNEWVEILNYGCDPVDLLDWTIEDASTNAPDWLVPLDGGSTVLGPGEYALIIDGMGSEVPTNMAWDIAPGTRIFGTDDAAIGNGLGNGGDTIVLRDEMGHVVDAVMYDDTDASGCGNEADGQGYSLERVDPLGPGDCTNFRSMELKDGGFPIGGTPGSENYLWVGRPCFIVIAGCDTGICNRWVEEGVALSDILDELLLVCIDEAKNHGQFVSCFSDGLNILKKEGVISGREKGNLQSCAAQAALP